MNKRPTATFDIKRWMTSTLIHPLVVCMLWTSCIVFTGACSVFDPTLLDAAGTGTTDLTRPPARPAEGTDGPDIEELFFTLNQIELNSGQNWESTGYDLDGLQTTRDNRQSECMVREAVPPEDGMGGIDNVFGQRVFQTFVGANEGLEETLINALNAGYGNPVIRLSGWNGEADDATVSVMLSFSVFGLQNADPPDRVSEDYVAYIGDEPAPLPRWDGNDYLWLRNDSFSLGQLDSPRAIDHRGYVRGRTLVFSIPDRQPIIFPGQEVDLQVMLTDAIITAEISEDRARLENVIVSGRWSKSDLLDTTPFLGVCQGQPGPFAFLEELVEQNLDVMSARSRNLPADPIMPDAGTIPMCDAFSVGLRWSGVRVNYGGMWEGKDPVDRCANPATGMQGDAGVMDAGVMDAGVMDAGVMDAGVMDAGMMDAGVMDARERDSDR